ncbi:hypothetical protein [Levilactobacillus brevis]|uniref:hypothetical protein n=1 Tax=Levilactobacillus brevis TaxID=1580 RepID=UPI0011198DD4|nr:hypothetical protein [Levilactobacillus brevis]QCZ44831.1 hypothetical protein UCCLBBS124_pA0035 [Levilactobacillus brevis]
MKLSKSAPIFFAIILLGVCSVIITPVQAATWHKGTPKELRGYYQFHKKQLDQYPSESIYANRIDHFSVVLPFYEVKKLKYKKIKKHVFQIKGTMQARKPAIPKKAKIETIYYLQTPYSGKNSKFLYYTTNQQYKKRKMKAFDKYDYYIKVY